MSTTTVSGHRRSTVARSTQGSPWTATASAPGSRPASGGWVLRPAARNTSAGGVWTAPTTTRCRAESHAEWASASAPTARAVTTRSPTTTFKRRRPRARMTAARRWPMRRSIGGRGRVTVVGGALTVDLQLTVRSAPWAAGYRGTPPCAARGPGAPRCARPPPPGRGRSSAGRRRPTLLRRPG